MLSLNRPRSGSMRSHILGDHGHLCWWARYVEHVDRCDSQNDLIPIPATREMAICKEGSLQ